MYTKHFDVESLEYYWYNTQIGTFLWEKPGGFGGWDVDPEDRVGETNGEELRGPQSCHGFIGHYVLAQEFMTDENCILN